MMKRDKLDVQEPFFPATGKPVIPLTQIDDSEKTLITQPRRRPAPEYAAPVYTLPEEALAVSVDEALLLKTFQKALQPRGLLRLRDSYRVDDRVPSRGEIKQKHIELLLESEKKLGRSSRFFYPSGFSVTVWIPAIEGLPQFVVEYFRPHL